MEDKVVEHKGKRFYTKLKFVKSEMSDTYIGFVSQDPSSKRIIGVRRDDEKPKMICVVDKPLVPQIVPNILYSATLVAMMGKKGFIVIEATPISFPASIETTYVAKAIYQVEVKFGNKTIIFDPKDGKKPCVNTISGVLDVLQKRMDIKDLPQVVDDFLEQANNLLNIYEKDGFYAKRTK